jgi:hypothetical protein
LVLAVETAAIQTKSACADSKIKGVFKPDLVLQPYRASFDAAEVDCWSVRNLLK